MRRKIHLFVLRKRQIALLTMLLLFLFACLPQKTEASEKMASGANVQICQGTYQKEQLIPDMKQKKIFELKHPECYAPVSTGFQAITHGISHVFGEILSATTSLANTIFFFLAPVMLVLAGAQAALGTSSGIVVPIGRSVLTLILAGSGITLLPVLVNKLIYQFQTWGTQTAGAMGPLVKADMAKNPIFTTGNTNVMSSFFSGSSNLDPISILKMGWEDSLSLVGVALREMPSVSLLHTAAAIENGFVWFATFLLTFMAAIGLLAVFAYAAAKAFSIILEAHLIVVFAPILSAFHALKAGGGNIPGADMYCIQKLVGLTLNAAFRLFVLYISLPILIAFQIAFINLAFSPG